MGERTPQNVSQLLQAWSKGQDEALQELLPLVHQELRRLAHSYMAGERAVREGPRLAGTR